MFNKLLTKTNDAAVTGRPWNLLAVNNLVNSLVFCSGLNHRSLDGIGLLLILWPCYVWKKGNNEPGSTIKPTLTGDARQPQQPVAPKWMNYYRITVIQHFLENNAPAAVATSCSRDFFCPHERRERQSTFPGKKEKKRKKSRMAGRDWLFSFIVISFFFLYFLTSARLPTSCITAIYWLVLLR